MQLDWSPVRSELAKWRRKGLSLPVWWRDDDAIEPTAQLDHMMRLSEECSVPVHLATIPRATTKVLAALVKENDTFIPVVHGWAHRNYEPTGEGRCEFGEARPLDVRREEAQEGLRRLRILMGDRVVPMFVPPWNRVPQAFLPDLAELGYRAVSTCHPRKAKEAAPGMLQINTHIDPLYWPPSKNLAKPELIVERVALMLKQRRQGKLDNEEPLGLLTHHLVHSPDIWEFCRQYWLELREGPIEVFHLP